VLDYNEVLEKDILNIVNDRNKFIEYYKEFKENIGNGKIDKLIVSAAYINLKDSFIKNK